MIKIKSIGLVLIVIILSHVGVLAQHSNEFYNKGANVTIQAGAQVYVWGDVHMDGGNMGNSGLIEVQGHWYNDNATSTQSGTGLAWFNNQDVNTTEVQQIRGTANLTGAAAFYDVELENRSASKRVDLNGVNVEIKNTLTFDATQADRLRTAISSGADGSAYANYVHVSNTSPSAIVNASTTSGATTLYVEGRLRRTMAAGSTYNYPVGVAMTGNGRDNQVAALALVGGSAPIVEGSFTQNANGALATGLVECFLAIPDTLKGVIDHGFWNLDLVGGTVSSYDLTVHAANFATTYLDHTIVKRNNGGVLNDFGYGGTADCDATTQAPGSVTRTGFSSFSDFGIGGGSSAFPIELVNLKATAIDNQFIRVSWTTAAEINNNGFEVLRSMDGVNFSKIGWVKGSGTTNDAHDYLLDDKTAKPNVVYYYRLNQIDNDGTTNLTNIVNAMLRGKDKYAEPIIFPNPVQLGDANITVSVVEPLDMTYLVYNNLGQLIYNGKQSMAVGLNRIELPSQDWAAGTYHIVVSDGATQKTVKMVAFK